MRTGTHVQLIEIPGITGRVVTDLYACEPPMLQVAWDGGGIGIIESTRVERVVFDWQSAEWVRETAPRGGRV